MVEKLKLAPYVLKRYEPKLDAYFFNNVSTTSYWKTDYITGIVIASIDGTLSRKDIIDVLASNNPDVSYKKLEEHFYKVFDFLIKEGYLCE